MRKTSEDGVKAVVRVAIGDSRKGTERALTALARDYMQMHPDVQVMVQAVPDGLYLQYLRTQLSSGESPDIMQIAGWLTGMKEMRDTHFLPLTRWVSQPNPYNAGAALADIPWRETYVDNLDTTECYSEDLRSYFGISLMMSTVRVFYNRQLYHAATGRTEPPRDYDELMAVCAEIGHYARKAGVRLMPFASSRNSTMFLVGFTAAALNQQLYYDLDARHTLSLDTWDYARTYLQGQWSFAEPSIRQSYQLMRELAGYHKPGFMQLKSGDALFEFSQQRAVMFTTQSRDATSMAEQVVFPVGAFPIPLPAPDNPAYAGRVLGPVSESFINTGLALGVIRNSRHRSAAVNFLQYLGSQAANERFARITGWLPAIRNAALPPGTEDYRPVMLGYPGRFLADLFGGGDARYTLSSNLHLLFAHDGGVNDFCDRMDELYGPALVRDLAKHAGDQLRSAIRQEPAVLAAWHLAQTGVVTPEERDVLLSASWREECVERIAGQNRSEEEALQIQYLLWRHAPRQTVSQP